MTALAANVSGTALPSDDVLVNMYRLMRVISAASDRASGEVRSGGLASAFYPVRGLEGVCGAMGAATKRTDYLVSTYRSLGDAIAKGSSLRRLIAELYGRSDGVCGGKGGPMHLHDVDAGFMTSTGIVGSGAPIAVGLAMAAQMDGDGRAVITTFGDGATSIGAVHEAMNMAGLWQLPIVFLCQNNQWGEHTPIAEYASNPNLSERARTYAMEAVQVDGFDPVATYHVLDAALKKARAGGGPTFVEALTYRLTGHTGSADYSYMPREELDAALARDPAPTFRRWLVEQHRLSESDIEKLDAEVNAEVADAFAFAMASPLPSPDLRYVDVFADQKDGPGL
jgi:acetoin:2,6-dichlorophenolindophenol oxidoreductase subunit alpha